MRADNKYCIESLHGSSEPFVQSKTGSNDISKKSVFISLSSTSCLTKQSSLDKLSPVVEKGSNLFELEIR